MWAGSAPGRSPIPMPTAHLGGSVGAVRPLLSPEHADLSTGRPLDSIFGYGVHASATPDVHAGYGSHASATPTHKKGAIYRAGFYYRALSFAQRHLLIDLTV